MSICGPSLMSPHDCFLPTCVPQSDPHREETLLTEGGRRWLSQFTWKQSPDIEATASVILPSWTNRQPDWRAVQPLLALDGHFKDCPGRRVSRYRPTGLKRISATRIWFGACRICSPFAPKGMPRCPSNRATAPKNFIFI